MVTQSKDLCTTENEKEIKACLQKKVNKTPKMTAREEKDTKLQDRKQ